MSLLSTFLLKRYLYELIKSHPYGISIFEIAQNCPQKTDLQDVCNCLEELEKDGKIRHDDYIVYAVGRT